MEMTVLVDFYLEGLRAPVNVLAQFAGKDNSYHRLSIGTSQMGQVV